MSFAARRYIAIIILLGAVVLVVELAKLDLRNPLQFLVLTAVAMLASGLKVSLPRVTGTMSLYFLFVLIGIVRLSPAQTLILAESATLVQCFWGAKRRPGWMQVAFNVAAAALGVTAAQAVFQWPLLVTLGAQLPLRLGVASLFFFVANTAPIAVVIALTEDKDSGVVWREAYFWCMPYYLAGASVAWLYDFTSRWWGWDWALLVLPPMFLLYRSYRLYLDRLESEKTHAEDMAALHIRTIEALAMSIDAKDHNTQEHLRRVQVYALELGKALDLPLPEIEALRTASVLHDIGKLAVPEYIISKPGKLTPEEFNKMKIHPAVGADILERVQFPYPVAPIVRAHHEKWDGSGYPHRLHGEEIPMGARILAVVDCFDALASDRPYHRALPLEDALAYVVKEAGRSYDPRVVEILRVNYLVYEQKAQLAVQEMAQLAISNPIRSSNPAAPGAGFEVTAEAPQDGATGILTTIAAAQLEVRALLDLTADLGQTLSLHQTLDVLAERLKALIPYDTLAMYLIRDGKLEAACTMGEEARLFQSLRIPLGQGISGWVAETGQSIINGTPSVEMGYLNDPELFSSLHSTLAVPLEGDRGTSGVLTLYRSARDAFSREELRMLQSIAPRLTRLIEEAVKFRESVNTASTDPLTGLPNGRSVLNRFQVELDTAQSEGGRVTVLLCDLDGFKKINDRFGHLNGNRVLIQLAGAILRLSSSGDYVARLGGDEFVLILPGLDDVAVLRRVEELEEAAREAGDAICNERSITVTTGVATCPDDGSVADDLIALASRRMMTQKRVRATARTSLRVVRMPPASGANG